MRKRALGECANARFGVRFVASSSAAAQAYAGVLPCAPESGTVPERWAPALSSSLRASPVGFAATGTCDPRRLHQGCRVPSPSLGPSSLLRQEDGPRRRRCPRRSHRSWALEPTAVSIPVGPRPRRPLAGGRTAFGLGLAPRATVTCSPLAESGWIKFRPTAHHERRPGSGLRSNPVTFDSGGSWGVGARGCKPPADWVLPAFAPCWQGRPSPGMALNP